MTRIVIRLPVSESEKSDYFRLRWLVLRKPLGMPPGSEQDEMESASYPLAAFNGKKLVACGRLQLNNADEGQIRYMATDPAFQNQGVGAKLLEALEVLARSLNVKTMVLEAREEALSFYRRAGYATVKKSHLLFGSIQHYSMRKEL